MTKPLPNFQSSRVIIKLALPDQAESVLEYYTRNQKHFADAGPLYPKEYFTVAYWQNQLTLNRLDFYAGTGARMFVFERAGAGDQCASVPIGHISLDEIVRRAAHFCYLGYCIDKDKEGGGYMREALQEVIRFTFEDLNLHRVMANYQPHNMRSGMILKRLGFTVEGYARDYLYINGKWCDHILTSLTNTEWKDA
jgi:ribosomal-protein-alanine N-acetyltransferase